MLMALLLRLLLVLLLPFAITLLGRDRDAEDEGVKG
jgi:hypothetical protein